MDKQLKTPMIVTPPKTSEYLPKAIQKAVLNFSLKHPITIYPLAIGASCGFVGWLFNIPFLYKIAIAGAVLGIFWPIISVLFLPNKIRKRYIQQLNEKQKQYEQNLREVLQEGLNECRSIKDAQAFADQGIKQLKYIQEKLENVNELLSLKLKTGELTFDRFVGAAEQVNLSVLDNLKDIVTILKSAGSIHIDYVREQISALEANEQKTENDKNQLESLKKRLGLWEEQLQKVHALLTKNEEAMTEMEQVSAAVAKWQTNSRFADTDFESAITRLQELAEQAHEYTE